MKQQQVVMEVIQGQPTQPQYATVGDQSPLPNDNSIDIDEELPSYDQVVFFTQTGNNMPIKTESAPIAHPKIGVNQDQSDHYKLSQGEGEIYRMGENPTQEGGEADLNQQKHHWKCLFFSVLLWYWMVAKILCSVISACGYYYDDDGYQPVSDCEFICFVDHPWFTTAVYIVMIIIYIIYLLESYLFSSTWKYVRNVSNESEATSCVNEWKKGIPSIEWVVQNYHHESRTTGHGDQRRTRRVRVNTACFRKTYNFASVRDVSLEFDIFSDIKVKPLTKLQFNKTFVFGNAQTEQDYNSRLMMFFSKSCTDVSQEFILHFRLAGFKPRMLCNHNEIGSKSSMVSGMAFSIFTLLSLSWVYRKWLDSTTSRKAFTVIKEIKV